MQSEARQDIEPVQTIFECGPQEKVRRELMHALGGNQNFRVSLQSASFKEVERWITAALSLGHWPTDL